MKPSFGYVLISVFILIGIVSCVDYNAFDEFEVINSDASYAIPLIDTDLSIRDVIDVPEADVTFRVDADDKISAFYNGSVARRSAIQIFPPIPLPINFPLRSDTSLLQIPFVAGFDYELERGIFKGNSIQFTFQSRRGENIRVETELLFLLENGATKKINFDLPFGDNGETQYTSERISVDGLELISNIDEMRVVHRAYDQTGTEVFLDAAFVNIDLLSFEYVEGFFGRQELDIQGDVIPIGIFDNWERGEISFADPRIILIVDNSFGFPVSAKVNKLEVLTVSGERIPLKSELVDKGIDFDFPNQSQIGQTIQTRLVFDNQNSNIVDLFNEKIIEVDYDIDAVGFPTNDPSEIGFVTDSSFYEVNVAVELPLLASADEFTIRDTLDLDMSELSEIDEVELKMYMRNEFPVEMDIQLIFLTSDDQYVDELFEIPLNIDGANMEGGMRATVPDAQEEEVLVSGARLDRIKNARKVIIRASLSTRNDRTTPVWLLDTYEIDFKMGAVLNRVN